MSYQLSAVVADADLLREATADLDHAVVGELRQDFALLPVTPQVVEELTGALPDFSVVERSAGDPFHLVLSTALTEVLARWSRRGPVAYLEAEFAGGAGYQAAAVWLGGDRSWGPRFDATLDGPREGWPINAALAELGAEPGPWIDAFAELGLHVERNTDGWLTHGRRRLTADYWDELAEEWELGQSSARQQPDGPGPVGDWGIP
ncbi:hypothetical protein [Micromonospora endolithica]|uniref:Uncharacterized protein n=1 Tax=Micromonospora endolithica TaxID=230091 RepID=A0A3A9Z3K5_9ACTN|nr:hypothetical protein [Micromonospora endolithica]RKN42838.1 hypothetical protein D7223_22530 [Micromonospora endolithica]TWJ25344.1 hypothetical protein JD76_05512 [Micromonospora endolithica]